MDKSAVVHVRPQHASYAPIRDAWQRAEAAGAETIFAWDHFFPHLGVPDALQD